MARDEIPLKGTCRNTICTIEEYNEKSYQHNTDSFFQQTKNQPFRKVVQQ